MHNMTQLLNQSTVTLSQPCVSLLQMQEYTHVIMQLSTGSLSYVRYYAPMPHACKQVTNTCPLEPCTSPLPSRGPHGGENATKKRVDVVEMSKKV